MSFKMIRPFVVEMITFILVVGTILVALIAGNFIEIIIHMHLLTVGAICFVLVWLIALFSRIVNTGVKALTDFLFQSTKEDIYIFLNEQPYRASIFAEKFGHDHDRSVGMYYLIHFKKEEEIFTLISPSYVHFVEGKAYRVKFGRASNILLETERDRGTVLREPF